MFGICKCIYLNVVCFIGDFSGLYAGMPVRAINRPGSQLLGANGRDDGPIVSSTCTFICF